MEDHSIPPTLPSVLCEQAAQRADETFVSVWAEGEGVCKIVSFAQFHARVRHATAELQRRGPLYQKGRIALLSHPTLDCFVYSMAIMAIGATAVQLNWRQPINGLEAMMQVSLARALLASAMLAEDARELAKRLEVKLLMLQVPEGAYSDCVANFDSSQAHGSLLAPQENSPLQKPAAVSPVALILFTSGSTGVPKAVPLTHTNLLWSCHHRLALHSADTFAPPSHQGTLSLLPNFHIVGFVNNFIFNLVAGIRCVVDRDAGRTPLTASKLLDACAAVNVTILDTVPYLVTEMLMLVDKGGADGMCLRQLQYILVGGAQLNEALLSPLLTKHQICVRPHYGQTELGGPALVGGNGSPMTCMRPLPGVQWMLEAENGEEAATEGELVLIGMGSATSGYLGREDAHELTGGPDLHTHERFHTGDIFRRHGPHELVHVCRRDDLICHSTGEMTNPLPIEAALISMCGDYICQLCVIGNRQSAPFVILAAQPAGSQPTSLARSAVARACRCGPTSAL